MTKLSSSRENFIKKRKEALTKLNSFRKNFKRREKEIKTDLEEADRIWEEISETYMWWQSLP